MKHKRRTKALSALLSLALLLSLLPGTAWAGTVPEEPTVIQMDGETLKKGDEAWTADDALALPAGSYRLDSDITTDKTISVSDEVTLDLNGFGILYTGNGNASVITVGSGATLTLMDTAAVERIHKITLTNGRGTAVETVETAETDDATTKYVTGGYITGGTGIKNGDSSYGGGVYVGSGTFNMSGGTISGNIVYGYNSPSFSGGGVYVGSGTFTMSGGTISGNKASGDYSRGGGVYVKGGGTFNMSGGTISSNTAGYLGGGVYVDGSAEFTMSGGTISGNTADYGGGGVFVWDGPTFTMSSGTISDNKADSGGGVFFYGSAEFTMSGGSVTGNSADYAGGVYANSNNQIITISGAPEITGNTDAVAGENTPSNLFLENDGGLPIIDAKGLTGLTDAKIGVSVYDDGNKSTYPDVFTQPFEEHDDAAAVKGCFTSDRENYAVVVTEENELMLTWLDTVTPSVTMTHGTVTAKPALPGKTVTLNVQPDSGYRLKSGSLKVLQYTQAINQGDVLTYEQIKSLVDANYTEDRLRVSYPRNTAYFILTSGSEEPDAWYKCGSSGLLSNNGTIPEGVTNTKLWLCSFSFPGGNFSKFSPFTEPADVAGTPIRQGKIVTFAEIEKAMEDTNTAYFVSSYEDTEASATKYMFDEGNGWIVTPGSNSTYSDKEALSSHDWLYLREADGYTFIAVDAISLTLDGYTFTMPDRPVTVFAEFEPAPADSDDDDPPPVTVPATNDTDSVAVSATVSGSTASVSTPSAAQLEQIVSESARDGGVTFDVSALNRTINSVSIPTATVKAVEQAVSEAASETAGLTVKLSGGAVSFDAQALTAITEQTSGSSIQFSLEDIGEKRLNSTQQNATSDMDVQAVYDAYMTSNGKRISDFKGGKATVTVPYALKNGQSRNGIAVWYIADDGSKTEMPSVYDGKDVRFTVEHFSNYVIAYDAERAAACPQDDSCPMSSFTDLNPALWYHDGIHFCLENGLMKGVGNDKFNPGGTTSRGMIVTILYRLEGEPKVTAENPFTDVEDGQWYADAVIWAAGNDIVSGYGGGKFGPNDNITREQLATILYRYAQSKGQGFEGSWMFLLDYPDASEVSSWADEAMHWMVMNGIINGKDGKLVPGGNASRAEAATMLQRFCENVAE